jgi:hypothetical protein
MPTALRRNLASPLHRRSPHGNTQGTEAKEREPAKKGKVKKIAGKGSWLERV